MESTNDQLKHSTATDGKPPVISSAGKYVDGVYVNQNGKQICEWCGSENITDPISDDCENGICNDCGSHW